MGGRVFEEEREKEASWWSWEGGGSWGEAKS